MNSLLPLSFRLFALSALPLLAEEHTVGKSPLVIEETISATILPRQASLALPPQPARWSSFPIVEIREHGSAIKQGDILIRFRTTDLDLAITANQREIAAKTLELESAEQNLARLESSAEHEIGKLEHQAQVAREELEYFTKTRRTLDGESSFQRLERAKQGLANEREELEQLKKMYEADEVTEETEEIILTRQKHAVEAAEFELKVETERNRRVVEVTLPREAMALAQTDRDATIALDQARKELPRSIQQKRLKVEELRKALADSKLAQSELEKDRSNCEIKAPGDGWLLHGTIQEGKWTLSESSKNLASGATPPANRPYATFVPKSAPHSLFAHVDAKVAHALDKGLKSIACLPGREEVKAVATIQEVAGIPGLDGSYPVILDAQWEKGENPPLASKVVVRCITYRNEEAIQVPSKALQLGPDGFRVRVKLADGKIETRSLKTGRVNGEFTEVIDGIEVGQVVILP